MTRVGVLGVGTISRCVLEGVCKAFQEGNTAGVDPRILISSRSVTNSQALVEQFPENIEIKQENKEIVEQCDWIVASVRPEQVEDLCKDLEFREDHIILNFISACLTEDAAAKVFAPAKRIVRISPWPCSKNRLGPVLVLNPPTEEVEKFLGLFGDVVKVENMDQFISMQSGSCFMAPFYQALDSITVWLEGQNIESEKASMFVGSLVHAFAEDAKKQGSSGFAHITAESQTKGGMNEQALNDLKAAGAFDALQKALTGLVERVKK